MSNRIGLSVGFLHSHLGSCCDFTELWSTVTELGSLPLLRKESSVDCLKPALRHDINPKH